MESLLRLNAAREAEARRFTRFLWVGLLNTGVGYALFAALILAGLSSTAAVIGSTVIGTIFNYRTISWIVFRCRDRRVLPRFLLLYVGQCAINIVLLHAAKATGASALLAGAVILPIIAVLTYIAMRQFVFKKAAV